LLYELRTAKFRRLKIILKDRKLMEIKDISTKLQSSSGLELKDIGNTLQIREEVDRQYKATNSIRVRFHVADLIPLRYQLNFKALHQNQSAVKYNFNAAFSEYQQICKNYGLTNSYAGVRLWMTDDTSVTENFTNDYGDNMIQSAISQISGIGQQLRDYANATGTDLPDLIKNSINSTSKTAASGVGKTAGLVGASEETSKAIESYLAGTLHTAAELIIAGKSISLPKVWKNSSYNPAVSFTVKLVSPYGHPDAINRYIIEPLLYILILTAPRTNDGLSYGLPRPVRIRAYGLSNINMGMIQNVLINRGSGLSMFNQYKQPLSIDVVITVSPLTDGFAVMESGVKDLATFSSVSKTFEDKTHKSDSFANSGNTPAITTVGNIIQSLRPAPDNVVRYFGSRPTISAAEIKNNMLTVVDKLSAAVDEAKSKFFGSRSIPDDDSMIV
jgi:hypothetical protein